MERKNQLAFLADPDILLYYFLSRSDPAFIHLNADKKEIRCKKVEMPSFFVGAFLYYLTIGFCCQRCVAHYLFRVVLWLTGVIVVWLVVAVVVIVVVVVVVVMTTLCL